LVLLEVFIEYIDIFETPVCFSIAGCLAQWYVRCGCDQRSYRTPGPVNTGMGDRSPVRVAFVPPQYLINHSGRLSLAIHPWVIAILAMVSTTAWKKTATSA